MDIALRPGRYVVAVSGGVDSTALLHMLAQQPDVKLVVAHFDHGIRPDSKDDRLHVQELSRKYGVPFVYDKGGLGAGTSEAAARKARYRFLHQVRQTSGAEAIVMAHHQDDAIETAIINLVRGTGRLGFSSLQSRPDVVRPLLHVPKIDIINYAKDNQLEWRDDSTNQDVRYFRNFVRHHVIPRLSTEDRQKLLDIIHHMHELNEEIDNNLANYLHLQPAAYQLTRHDFIMLPHRVAREVMASWLRARGIRNFTSETLERLVRAAKTFGIGRQADVNLNHCLVVGKDALALAPRDR